MSTHRTNAQKMFDGTYKACYQMYLEHPDKRGCGLDYIIPAGKITNGSLNAVALELRRYEQRLTTPPQLSPEDESIEWVLCAMVRATLDNTYKAPQAARQETGTGRLTNPAR